MHIISIKVLEMWVEFNIENVISKDAKGKKTEQVQATATFVKDGERIHKIYKLGNFDYCTKLLDKDFAKSEALRMIENANRSKHSPFNN